MRCAFSVLHCSIRKRRSSSASGSSDTAGAGAAGGGLGFGGISWAQLSGERPHEVAQTLAASAHQTGAFTRSDRDAGRWDPSTHADRPHERAIRLAASRGIRVGAAQHFRALANGSASRQHAF